RGLVRAAGEKIGFTEKTEDRRVELRGDLRRALEQRNRLGESAPARIRGTQDGRGHRPQGGEVATPAQPDGPRGARSRRTEAPATQVARPRAAAGVNEPVRTIHRFGPRNGLVGPRDGLREVAELGKAPSEEHAGVHELLGLTLL